MLCRGLLTEELEEVFRGAPAAPNAVASERVREAHAKATGKAPIPAASSSSSSQPKRKIPEAEDDCPICYESMHNQPEAKLTWCEACGNALHKECFQQCAFLPCSTFLVPVVNTTRRANHLENARQEADVRVLSRRLDRTRWEWRWKWKCPSGCWGVSESVPGRGAQPSARYFYTTNLIRTS